MPKSKSQGHVEANAAFGFELTSADAGTDLREGFEGVGR